MIDICEIRETFFPNHKKYRNIFRKTLCHSHTLAIIESNEMIVFSTVSKFRIVLNWKLPDRELYSSL